MQLSVLQVPVAFALVFIVLPSALAQESASSNPADALELNELITAIHGSNSSLKVSELRRRAAVAEIPAAGALDDPRVNYAIAPSSLGDSIPSNLGSAVGVRQVMQFSQAVPWPGKRSLRTDLAESRAELAALSREELLAALVDQGTRLWLQMWFVVAAQQVNAEQQTLLVELENTVATQYANGLGLQQQVLEVQSEQIKIEHRQFVLEQELRRLQAQVNQLLDRAPSTPVGLPSEELPSVALPAQQEVYPLILSSSPELRRLRARVRMENVEQDLVALDDFPDFQVNVGYNELWNDSSLRTLVGVSINIPIDFGKRSARKAAAGFEYSSALADVTRLKIALQAEAEQLLSHYDELTHSITLFEDQLLPTAMQTYEASLANYSGGGGSFRSIVEAQEEILKLNLQLLQMRTDQPITVSKLNRLANGKLWPQEIPQ